jgi:phosphatidylglycerol:prolipoprotein diacylglycerol transferase
MLIHPSFDPVAFSLGPLSVRWYGLMYLVGFASGLWLLTRRAARPNSGWTAEEVNDLIFYGAMGVVLGGRVGYMLFYGWDNIMRDPSSILRIWEGGMSFHGGLLGVMLAMWLFGRKTGKGMWQILDFGAPIVPIGLGAGRIGNFINGELVGRTTDVPWAMVFPQVDSLPRHPSQLYEFFFEGVVMFSVLWWFSSKERPRFAVSGMFALLYGIFRFGVEFSRQPDAHLGFIAMHWMTMGQVLSVPLIVVGIVLLSKAYSPKSH